MTDKVRTELRTSSGRSTNDAVCNLIFIPILKVGGVELAVALVKLIICKLARFQYVFVEA